MATLFAPRRAGVADKARVAPASDPPPPTGPHAVAFQRGREVAALLLTVTAVFTALALVSFQGSPGESDVDSNNWVGPVGNWWAHWMVSGIGVGAVAMPLELCLLAWPLLRNQASIATVARLAGDFLVILIFASLTQVALPGAVAFGAMPAAGGVGELFGETMRSLFSTVGSFLVGLTAIGLILIMRASFSFIGSAQKALRGTEVAATKAAFGARAVAEAWERAAELRKKQDDELRRSKQPIIHDPNEAGDALVAALAEDEGTPDAPPMVLHVDKHGTPRPPGLDDDPKETPKKKQRRRKDTTPPAPVVEEREIVALEATIEDDEPDEEPEPEIEEPAPKRRVVKVDEPQIVDHVAELAAAPVSRARVEPRHVAGFVMPSTSMLEPPPATLPREDKEALLARARELEKVLANYGVRGTVADIHTGPTVSTFEVVPAEGTKVSKVAGLADDLALGLSCKVRIVAPIPGKSRIGFELPNRERIPVSLRELVEDPRFQEMNVPLPVVLGRDIVGAPFYADLASMPHVIVAGATGAGKSVGLNVMLVSLLMRRSPDDLRLLMIDPKVVELAPFDRIPHLLLPVVTDMKQASNALKWAVDEMERRYQLFANAGTKNISTYNGWVARAHRGEIKGFAPPPTPSATTDDGTVVELGAERELPKLPEKLPFIVIVVDEFADLMMQQGKDVEVAVARLAQKARAAGMHVILATQRPSVDVITGMIKANFPTRIGFRVAQRIDSRTILDEQGAEHLLGRGDMLVKMNGTNDTRRVQCPFVSEEEVQAVTDHLRKQGEPVYDESILKNRDEDGAPVEEDDAELDSRYDDAVRVVAETRRCSTSWLQRKLGLGYNRAAKIVETMEKRGVVGPANGTKDREVMIGPL